MREGCSVNYYTDSQRWKFFYHHKLLAVKFSTSKQIKSRDPSRNTYVEVRALCSDRFDFSDFLMLQPPSQTLPSPPSASSVGYLCIDDIYQHKIFVKGLLVESNQKRKSGITGFIYGYNILASIPLGRDCRIDGNKDEICSQLHEIFSALLSDVKIQDKAADAYLKLWIKHPQSLDI